MIVGTFPNFEQVIPKSYEWSVKYNRKELLKELKTVVSLSDKKHPPKIIFTLDGFVTNIHGTAKIDIKIDSILNRDSKEFTEFAVNGQYMIDYLTKSTGKDVIIKVGKTNLAPLILVDSLESKVVVVIMPMMVEDFKK